MDQLNIIHVTGTKGKVKGGIRGRESVSTGWGGDCPDKNFSF